MDAKWRKWEMVGNSAKWWEMVEIPFFGKGKKIPPVWR